MCTSFYINSSNVLCIVKYMTLTFWTGEKRTLLQNIHALGDLDENCDLCVVCISHTDQFNSLHYFHIGEKRKKKNHSIFKLHRALVGYTS